MDGSDFFFSFKKHAKEQNFGVYMIIIFYIILSIYLFVYLFLFLTWVVC